MPDLLLEFFSEEIPARMQARAADDLKKLVTDKLVAAGLLYDGAKAFATPRRLALAAEKVAYGEKDIVYSGPLYDTSRIDGNKIIVSFTNIGGGLVSKDSEELSQFSIAGADKKFVWAKAKIDADKVVVWNDAVQQPMYVRYAWADNPYGANLANKEGLPASPFRTDQ